MYYILVFEIVDFVLTVTVQFNQYETVLFYELIYVLKRNIPFKNENTQTGSL